MGMVSLPAARIDEVEMLEVAGVHVSLAEGWTHITLKDPLTYIPGHTTLYNVEMQVRNGNDTYIANINLIATPNAIESMASSFGILYANGSFSRSDISSIAYSAATGEISVRFAWVIGYVSKCVLTRTKLK